MREGVHEGGREHRWEGVSTEGTGEGTGYGREGRAEDPARRGGHGRTGWPGGACTRSIKPRVPSGPRATRCIGASFSSRRLALHTRTAAMLTDESRPMGGFILLEN